MLNTRILLFLSYYSIICSFVRFPRYVKDFKYIINSNRLKISNNNYDIAINEFVNYPSIANDLMIQLQDTLNVITNNKVINHPGFPFSLDCNNWSSSGYNGSVQTWSCSPYIEWMSHSKIKLDNNKLFLYDDNYNNSQLLYRDEIIIWSSINSTIPHLRLRIDSTFVLNSTYDKSTKLIVYLDYIPRLDLVSNLDYYDIYYKDNNKQISIKGINHIKSSVITNLISSPCYLLYSLPVNNETYSYTKEQCVDHIKRYIEWVNINHRDSITSNFSIKHDREESLFKLLFDDVKFSIADVLGPLFAPKASEISAAMLGPTSVKFLI